MIFGPLAAIASLAWSMLDPNAATLTPREVVFPFDDETRLPRGEHFGGKLWRSHDLPYDGSAVPLMIFVHGVIVDGQAHHWLTVDPAGPWDARIFMEELVDEGRVTPMIVAVPSQVVGGNDASRLFVDLDTDAFVTAVEQALGGSQKIDRERIVVVGHSGSACNPKDAAFASLHAKTFHPRALFSIDGCMIPDDGPFLALTSGARDVIVTYQTALWDRPIDYFKSAWELALAKAEPKPSGLRVLERWSEPAENAHLEIVAATLRRWLPQILPAPPRSPIPRVF